MIYFLDFIENKMKFYIEYLCNELIYSNNFIVSFFQKVEKIALIVKQNPTSLMTDCSDTTAQFFLEEESLLKVHKMCLKKSE